MTSTCQYWDRPSSEIGLLKKLLADFLQHPNFSPGKKERKAAHDLSPPEKLPRYVGPAQRHAAIRHRLVAEGSNPADLTKSPLTALDKKCEVIANTPSNY